MWGSGCIDPCILEIDNVLEVSGQLHTPVALAPGKELPVPNE
jgi:hypothetical protein